jgi:hypothetical protein
MGFFEIGSICPDWLAQSKKKDILALLCQILLRSGASFGPITVDKKMGTTDCKALAHGAPILATWETLIVLAEPQEKQKCRADINSRQALFLLDMPRWSQGWGAGRT